MRFPDAFMIFPVLGMIAFSCNSPETISPDFLPDTRFPVMPGSVFSSAVDADPIVPFGVSDEPEIIPFFENFSRLDLSGEWRYRPDPREQGDEEDPPWYSPERVDSDWSAMPVPSHFARQDPDLADFYRPVWFRRHFFLEESMLERSESFDLMFEGVDYFAEVWVNGVFVGAHEGYFNPFRFEVTSRLRPGDNLLAVKVTNPYDYGLKGEAPLLGLSEKIWVKGSLNFDDCRPGGTMLGSRESQTRGTGGIYRPVVLRGYGEISIDAVFVTPRLEPDLAKATVRLDYVLTNHTGGRVRAGVATRISGETFASGTTAALTAEVSLPPGPHRFSLSFPVDSPRLWWPAGFPELGDPHLYAAESRVYRSTGVSDYRKDTFGIRNVEVESVGGEPAVWYINGKRLFLRGADAQVGSAYLAEADDFYPRDFELLREAGMNVFRSYAHVDPPAMYDFADRFGIGVLSEFSLKGGYSLCGFDRSNGSTGLTGNLEVMRRMLAEAMYLHYNHPSVLAWSLHSEPSYVRVDGAPREAAASCGPEPYREGEHVPFGDPTFNYSLDGELKEVAESIDPGRVVLLPGRGESTRYGPGWNWGVWGDAGEISAPLPDKFGAQGIAYSAEEWLREELGPDFFPPLVPRADEQVRRGWLFHGAQLANLGVYLGRADGETYTDFREYAFASQVYQAELTRMAIERFRIQRFGPVGGYFLFPFFQWWPSITWGVVDHEREHLLAYEWITRVNTPLLVAGEMSRRIFGSGDVLECTLYAVNDRHVAFPGARLEAMLTEEEDSLVIRGEPAAWGDSPSYFALPPDNPVLVSFGTGGVTAPVVTREFMLDLDPDAVVAGGVLQFTFPSGDGESHHYTLSLFLAGPDGALLAENRYHFLSVPDPDAFQPPPGVHLFRENGEFDPCPRFSLSVTVRENGSACAGCRVELVSRYTDPPLSEESETDPAGVAFFSGLSPGAYAVRGSAPTDYSVEVLLNRNTEITVGTP